MRTLHKVLGLSSDASRSVLRRAYQQQVLQCHPDVSSDASAHGFFLTVQSAWEDYISSQRSLDGPSATAQAPDLEMLLLKLKTKFDGPRQELGHLLRESVTASVQDLGFDANVRRVHFRDDDHVELHVSANSPIQREDMRALIQGRRRRRSLCDRSCTGSCESGQQAPVFMDALNDSVRSAILWQSAEAPLELAACLPYTMPAPAAPMICKSGQRAAP